MGRDEITHTQLTALLWAGILAPAAELLPALTIGAAGRGGWLAPALCAPLVLLGGRLLSGLDRGGGAARSLRQGLGPWAGRGVLLVYLLWFELLLAVRLRMCARRLLSAGDRDGSLWFFLAVTAGLALWMGLGKLSAFARAGQVFLAVLLAAGGVVLALSVGQVRLTRLLPLSWGEQGAAVRAALPAAGLLGWGMGGAFLTGQVDRREDRGRWHRSFWGAGGCLLLSAALGIIQGNLGAGLAGRLESPFFALAKSVGVKGAFQRVESVAAALWTFSDLAMAGVLLFALRSIWRELRPAGKEKRGAAALLTAAVLLAAGPLSEENAILHWSRELVPAGNLILGAGVPALLGVLLRLCEKGRNGGISCGKKQVKRGRYSCPGETGKNSEKNEKRC